MSLLVSYFALFIHNHFLQPLTVTQIKKIQSLIEESSDRNKAEMKECEVERYKHLVMIGNVLHPSVPISDDEVWNGREMWREEGDRAEEGGTERRGSEMFGIES